MSVLGSFEDIRYDVKTRMWKINFFQFDKLKVLDKRLFPSKTSYQKQKEHMSSIITFEKKEITGTEEIGAGLKLQPYQYQKEVIKFAYDVENCLIIAPCGAGK